MCKEKYDCEFCNLQKNPGASLPEYLQDTPVDGLCQDIIYKGEYFYVKPDISPVVENHLLIIPQKHIFCMKDIPVEYEDELNEIKNLGYFGIKIHPRLAKIEPDDDKIFDIISQANKLNLIVIYCGFLGASEKFVENIGDEKIIFLHTGGKDIKNTFEMLKDKKNILLDVSYTFTKYPETEDIIKNIFENYSDRICIGSDHPEVTMQELRDRFEHFSSNLYL